MTASFRFVPPTTFLDFTERYPAAVYNYANYLLRYYDYDPAATDDLAQSLCLTLLDKQVIEKFDPTIYQELNEQLYFSYLGMIMTRHHQTMYRASYASARRVHTESHSLTATVPGTDIQYEELLRYEYDPDDVVALSERRDYLAKQCPKYLQIWDKLLAGYSVQEIADSAGVSRQNIATKSKTLMEKLAKYANGRRR